MDRRRLHSARTLAMLRHFQRRGEIFMRKIYKAPLLKQGSRGPAVKDVQNLLNDFQKDNPRWTKTKALVPDGKYGPLTAGKVHDFQKSAALVPDGIVGPATCAVLFAPQADLVDKAQGIATNWTFLARAAVQTVQAHVRALLFNQPLPPAGNLPLLFDALRTHFHTDLAGAGGTSQFDLLMADNQLSFMDQVYEDALFVLLNASIREGRVFYSMGVEQSVDRDLFGDSAATGYFPKGTKDTILVAFPPTFHITTNKDVFRTISQQASTVLHEVCHYVRPEGGNRVTDFAYGLPAFQGKPGRASKSGGNYKQITAEEATHNAESYNLFAEHVTFGHDTRFGRTKEDLDAFQCGCQL
jgi:peptidoglycan hydrolase-like protein with peptidoglycan-binding domain